MRAKKYFWRALLALAVVVLAANIAFWVLVGLQFGPLTRTYESGRVVRIGPVALVFGHGSWSDMAGIEEHFTTVNDHGEEIYVPTLELVQRLHQEGRIWIWGSWCYSGDRDYIRHDFITGETIEWPSYVSRNQSPGVTLPVWLGVGFYRASVGKAHQDEPGHPSFSIPRDTFVVRFDFAQHGSRESAEESAERQVQWAWDNSTLPKPDSVTGITMKTVVWDETEDTQDWRREYKRYENRELSYDEWRALAGRIVDAREQKQNLAKAQVAEAITVSQAKAWIRGVPLTILVKIDPFVDHKH